MLLLSLGILIIAEGLNILAEMYAARLGGIRALFEQQNLYLFVVVFIGCSLLLTGYAIGYSAAKNIWVVTAMSIGGILVVEPFLAWTFFHEIPTKGAIVGLVLGTIGLIATIIWK